MKLRRLSIFFFPTFGRISNDEVSLSPSSLSEPPALSAAARAVIAAALACAAARAAVTMWSEGVAAFACELARHRAGTMLEAKDVQLAIEKNWNLRLAGLDGGTELKVIKKTTTTNVHRQRQNQVRGGHLGECIGAEKARK